MTATAREAASVAERTDTLPAPGLSPARYVIEHRLAEGGDGEVFQAFDTRLRRRVALKRLSVVPGSDAAAIYERARREAVHLAALQHPNVIAVYDFDADAQGPFLIMELVEGETLDAVVSRGAFPLEDFWWLAQQTLEGVAATHRAGLLHHDLKPGNLMLRYGPSHELQVKIVDFGLADFPTEPDPPPAPGQPGIVLGTVEFMAPERFEHQPGGMRGELYSAGCIFYYALTGADPFGGGTDAEVIANHLAGAVVPLERLRPDLPPAVCAWVMRLISRQSEDRPASVPQALLELRELF